MQRRTAKIYIATAMQSARRADVSKIKRKRELIPRWNMPSDPVKAVFWFMHWLLRVLVRFFWILILVGILYETFLNSRVGGLVNGIVAGVVTLLVGLGVWTGLGVVLLLFNISSGISRTISEVSRVQQGFPPRRPFYPFADVTEPDIEGEVVEGTITDLEEERKKRRSE